MVVPRRAALPTISLGPPRIPLFWRASQAAGVGLTLILIAGLFMRPEQALHVLWGMVIPLLPAVFVVNPMLWRNVCPLATLNSGVGRRVGTVSLGITATRATWVVGIGLLFALVPARRFLFNTDGPALAVTILAVVALALVAGVLSSRRSGFCNTICPVLAVEKLYGQAPLVPVTTARCSSCALCVPIGCIDLARRKTIAQTLGPSRRTRGWLVSTFGIFAAAFPGFVVGYFTVPDGALSMAAAVYGHAALYAIASYFIVSAITWIGMLTADTVLPVLGAASFMLYYWFSAPALGAAYGSPGLGTLLIRIGAAVLIAAWLWKWSRRAGPAGTTPLSREHEVASPL